MGTKERTVTGIIVALVVITALSSVLWAFERSRRVSLEHELERERQLLGEYRDDLAAVGRGIEEAGELAGQLGDGLRDAIERAQRITGYRELAQLAIEEVRAGLARSTEVRSVLEKSGEILGRRVEEGGDREGRDREETLGL